MAEALVDDAYARRLLAGGDGGFEREVLAMHRRLTGAVDVAGTLQVPWPRAIGTPPWALARQLARRPLRRRFVFGRLRPDRAWTAMTSGLAQGGPVPAYVGSRWLPRHVVLAVELLDDAVRVYDPGSGRVVGVTREAWVEGRLPLAGWCEPWGVVSS